MANNTLKSVQAAFGALNAGVDFGTNLANYIDGKVREQGEIQARNAQLQYQKDAAQFLTDLENSDDVTNWQSRANSWLEEYNNKLQSQAQSGYAAKLMKDQMAQNSTQMNINLIHQVDKVMDKRYMVESEKELSLIKDNYVGQERIDQSMRVLNDMKSKGKIDDDQHEKMAKQIMAGAQFDYMTSMSNSIVSQAIANGWTEKEVNAKLSEMKNGDLSYSSVYGVSKLTSDEVKELKSKIIKDAKNSYDVKVKEIQDANVESLSQYVVQMNQYPEGDPRREQIKAWGRSKLGQMEKNPIALTSSQSMSFSEKFKPHKETDGDGSGTSKTYKKATSDWWSLLQKDLDNAKLGTNSGEPGYKSVRTVTDNIDRYVDASNLSEDEKRQAKSWLYEQSIEYASREWKKLPNVSEAMAQCEKYLHTIKRDDLKGVMTDRLLDFFFDNDVSTMRPEEAVKFINKTMEAVAYQNLEGMQLDKNGMSKLIDVKKDGSIKYNEKDILKAMNNIKENHLVYTNTFDQTSYAPGVEKNVKAIDSYNASVLQKYGVNPENLTPSWETDGKHDYTGNRSYTDNTTGHTYTFVPTDNGKDFKILLDGDTLAANKKDVNTLSKIRGQEEKDAIWREEMVKMTTTDNEMNKLKEENQAIQYAQRRTGALVTSQNIPESEKKKIVEEEKKRRNGNK